MQKYQVLMDDGIWKRVGRVSGGKFLLDFKNVWNDTEHQEKASLLPSQGVTLKDMSG